MVAASGHLDESKKRKTVTCQCSKQELVLGSEAEPSLVKNPPPRTVEESDVSPKLRETKPDLEDSHRC